VLRRAVCKETGAAACPRDPIDGHGGLTRASSPELPPRATVDWRLTAFSSTSTRTSVSPKSLPLPREAWGDEVMGKIQKPVCRLQSATKQAALNASVKQKNPFSAPASQPCGTFGGFRLSLAGEIRRGEAMLVCMVVKCCL